MARSQPLNCEIAASRPQGWHIGGVKSCEGIAAMTIRAALLPSSSLPRRADVGRGKPLSRADHRDRHRRGQSPDRLCRVPGRRTHQGRASCASPAIRACRPTRRMPPSACATIPIATRRAASRRTTNKARATAPSCYQSISMRPPSTRCSPRSAPSRGFRAGRCLPCSPSCGLPRGATSSPPMPSNGSGKARAARGRLQARRLHRAAGCRGAARSRRQ